MKGIHLVITFCFLKEVTSKTIWKQLLAPDDPPLIRVRNTNQARGLEDFIILDFIGLIEQYSYPAEEHNVTTEDGYQLKLHRIPNSPHSESTQKKKVVFIQHGAAASSDTWVLEGPDRDLPFILADLGYDVWLGNLRGNTYCRSHVNLSTSDPHFWQFSFHEHGIYDLASMVDYVLNYTQNEKLYYIGHSMGSTISYVLLSMKPEYNVKFKLVVNLSPIAFWKHGVSPVINNIVENRQTIKKFFDTNDIYDVLSLNIVNIKTARSFCRESSPVQAFCETLVFIIAGNDPDQLNKTSLEKFLSYYPAGVSVKMLQHYVQNIVTGDFQLFDYGFPINYYLYKQRTSPTYNLKRITAPFVIFYGKNDGFLNVPNAMEINNHLPNIVAFEEVPFELFTHFDFILGKDRKTLVYNRLIKLMEQF